MRYSERLTTLYSVTDDSGRYTHLYSVPVRGGMVLYQSIGYDAYMRTSTARMTREEAAEDLRLWRQGYAKIVNVSRAMYK